MRSVQENSLKRSLQRPLASKTRNVKKKLDCSLCSSGVIGMWACSRQRPSMNMKKSLQLSMSLATGVHNLVDFRQVRTAAPAPVRHEPIAASEEVLDSFRKRNGPSTWSWSRGSRCLFTAAE